jgi:hypothetical protein
MRCGCAVGESTAAPTERAAPRIRSENPAAHAPKAPFRRNYAVRPGNLREFRLNRDRAVTDERSQTRGKNIMTKKSLLTRAGRALATNVALVVVGLACMQAAHAGCGQYGGAKKLVDSLSPSALDAPRFIRAAYQLVDDESSDWRDHRQPPITGLWYFQYLSKGNKALGIPDGAILDQGNTIWFADGNEMTSSAMRAPDTGSICLGIWERTGESTYELNHIGNSWDPVHNVSAGPAFIKQYVTLEKGGDKYTGVVTIIQYKAGGKSVDVELKGIITATRQTVNTKSQP